MITWAARQFASFHARKVQDAMLRPREAQARTFLRLRSLLAGSEAARVSGFDGCASLDALRRLPTTDSEQLAPVLREVHQGGRAQARLFGRSRLLGFLRTSGSRGEPKLIPLNTAALASIDRTLVRMVSSHFFTTNHWEGLLRGRHVFLNSRLNVGASPTGLPVFDTSALYPTRSPWWVRWAMLPRRADLRLADWADKRDRALEQARALDVVSITGLPALAIDFARRAKERFGVRTLDELWPRLSQFSYGGVGLSAAQRAQLAQSWFSPGHEVRFFETYFASEAPLGFAFDAKDNALALNTLENLYLFQPVDGTELLLADELREGARYVLHVSTPGGLVNFRMGDLVDVVSTRPLLVRVAGRQGEELSLTGEKITVAQLDLALAAAGLSPERLGVHLPVAYGGGTVERPHLVWGVPDVPAASDASSARLDEALCAANLLYAEALRVERVIDPSRIERIPVAVFEAHRQARLGNYKPKRIFATRADCAAWYGWAPADV